MYGHFPGRNFDLFFSHVVAERLEGGGRGCGKGYHNWCRLNQDKTLRGIFGAMTEDWMLGVLYSNHYAKTDIISNVYSIIHK